MENIQALLNKLDKNKSRYVSFCDGTLGDRMLGYIWYRLRYFSIKSLLLIFVHCIEFYLLFIVFSYQVAVSILTFRIIGFIASSFWWGALESLRDTIRKLSKNKQNTEIALLNKRWMMSAYGFAILVSLAFIALLIAKSMDIPTQHNGLFYFYAIAILIEVNVRLIVLTMHSTCFATQRVYRPFYSIIAPPIAGLIVLAILWVPLGGYGLVISGLTQTGLALYWSWHFSKRMLQHKRIPIKHTTKRQPPILAKNAVPSAISSLFMEGSGIIILILLHDFTSFYLLIPLISICFNWSKLFYFDNIKYQDFWLKALLDKFNKAAHYVSIIIAVSLTLIAYLVLATITSHHDPILILGLLLFFISRALLSIKQIILFTQRNYFKLIAYNSCLLIFILILSFYNLSLYHLFLFIAAAQFIIFGFLTLDKSNKIIYDKYNLYLPLYPWLDLVNGRNISAVEFSDDCTHQDRNNITLAIKNRLGPNTLIALKDKKTIYIASNITPDNNFKDWLTTQCGGLVTNYIETTQLHHKPPINNLQEFNDACKVNPNSNHILDLQDKQHTITIPDISYNELFHKINTYMLMPNTTTRINSYKLTVLYQNHCIQKVLLFTTPPP
jgi:hypothetical protein